MLASSALPCARATKERSILALEMLQVASDVSRRATLGEPTRATETQFQLLVRYALPDPR